MTAARVQSEALAVTNKTTVLRADCWEVDTGCKCNWCKHETVH